MNEHDREESACQSVDVSRQGWTQRLSRTPPRGRALEFTGPEAFWPPKVKGLTNVRQIPWEAPPGELTESLELQIRQAALADATVCKALGERHAHINTTVIDPGKDEEHHCFATRVTFFSHTHNRAIRVAMEGLRVADVAVHVGYHPPEGASEIRMAIELARNDSRLHEKTLNLTGKGILAHLGPDAPGAGHRVLHVTFTYPGGYTPVYWADVDLTATQVLSVDSLDAQ